MTKEDHAFVSKLLESGAQVDAKDVLGRTPLMFACFSGNTSIVHTLISMGANANTLDNKGLNPLFYAVRMPMVRNGHFDGKNSKLPPQYCYLPLDGACKSVDNYGCYGEYNPTKHFYTAMSLFTPGGKVLPSTSDYSELIFAVLSGDSDLLKILVSHGCDVNKRAKIDEKGNKTTALCMAITSGNLALADWLLSNGADPCLADGFGQTPLALAAWRNYISIACRLLRYPQVKENDVCSLPKAAQAGHYEMVKLLLESGFDSHQTDDSGTTALGWASFGREDRDIINILRSYGARY